MRNDGGKLWILGMKTEKTGTVVETINGSITDARGHLHLLEPGLGRESARLRDPRRHGHTRRPERAELQPTPGFAVVPRDPGFRTRELKDSTVGTI